MTQENLFNFTWKLILCKDKGGEVGEILENFCGNKNQYEVIKKLFNERFMFSS